MAGANSGDSRPSNLGTAIRPTGGGKVYSASSVIPEQYRMTLDVRGDDTLTSDGSKLFPIIAALPERYNINFSSDWNAPFSNTSATDFVKQAAGGGVLGDALKYGADLIGKAVGVSTRLKSQSVQVWEGSSALSFSLDLIFNAKTNSEVDIRDKHLALLKLAAPSETGPGGEVLMQPGPVIADQLWNKKSRKISLQVGTYLFFDNVIIRNVGSDVETICDEKGIPLSITINIEITTLYASFTAQDIEKAFKGARGG